MRPRTRAALAPVLLLAGAACQARAPSARHPVPPPLARDFERFGVTEQGQGASPLDLVAALGPAEGTTPSPAVDEGRPGEAPARESFLTFEDLLYSVESRFPLVLAALEELEIAAGELTAARGRFDSYLKADGDYELTGFYENERTKLMLEQPTTLWGATFFGGYKLGTGDFAVWDGDLKTNEGGEFSAGVRLPLLAGRRIDERRLLLWQAELGRAQADPIVLAKRLDATRKAASSYWKWVAAGQKLEIAERLLALAENRQAGVALAVEEGELPPIALTENQRLVVERQSILVRARRTLEQAAIQLSLFWRDDEGRPRLPGVEVLPPVLPVPRDPALTIRPADADLARAQRPELRGLELELESLRLAVEQAENKLLPMLDVGVAASQDVGAAVSTPDDKGPGELEASFRFALPLQRRAARGKTRSLTAKAAKLERELQLARDSVVAEVRDSASALRQTWLRLEQVRENVRLAGLLEEAERLRLREGQSDLLRVNLREQQTASAASMLVDVVAEHFRALADYRASLGLPYDEIVAGRAPGL